MTYLRRGIHRHATRVPRQSMRYPSTTLPAGTIVLTLRGALSVEDLHRGDRVVTKAGASEVKRVHTREPDNFTLEFDNHETVYVLGDPSLPAGAPAGSGE